MIIVTYNGMSWIERCLKSLELSTIKLEAFIVDNGSIDGTIECVEKWGQYVSFVKSRVNLRFGRANNLGIQYAIENGYEYVYLLNQDAWLYPETIQQLIDCQRKHPEYGILSPTQIKKDEKHFESIFLSGVCPRVMKGNLVEDLYFGQLQDIYEVPDVMAAHWLISGKCLKTVGGFSPFFPHYGEDDNYVNRTRYYGFKVGFVPKAKAVHDADAHPADRKKKIYLTDIYMRIQLQKVYEPLKYPYCRMLIYAIKSSVALMSIKPLNYYLKLLLQRRYVNNVKEQSKGLCPFLP